jgi:import inner membrane translocase subunit TIM23
MASASSNPASSGSGDLLRSAQFSQYNASGSNDDMQAPTAAQMLSNAASLHPLAQLQSQDLDYLELDDGKLSGIEGGQTVLPSRGWGDELCYGTGTTYLSGKGASHTPCDQPEIIS